MKKVRTAIFPVAGLGTRFLPATKASPKEMLIVGDMPLIQHAVVEAMEAGIERFIFITSQGKTAIEDHFDSNQLLENVLQERSKIEDLAKVRQTQLEPGQAIFIRQQHPLGLGHAVWCARHLIQDEPFALLLADDLILSQTPCTKQLVQAYENNGPGNYTAVMEVAAEKVSRYGILDIADQKNGVISARSVVEKPDPETSPSRTAIVGRYILDPRVFNHINTQKVGIGQEIQLTDAFNPMIAQNIPFSGVLFEGERFDCGTKEGWLEANIAYAYNDPELQPSLLKAITKYHS
nr:UTP--glucose-1-phosphate uridylyltransferase [Candidatus Paracaedibacter symbiosus]